MARSLSLELVAFDVAGTTLTVTRQVPYAFRHAFSTQGLRVDDPQIRDVRGVSKRTAIREILEGLLPDADGIALAEMSDAILRPSRSTFWRDTGLRRYIPSPGSRRCSNGCGTGEYPSPSPRD